MNYETDKLKKKTLIYGRIPRTECFEKSYEYETSRRNVPLCRTPSEEWSTSVVLLWRKRRAAFPSINKIKCYRL